MLPLELDYLNPFAKYAEEIVLEMSCDKQPKSISVRGGGPGWSLQFRSWQEIQNQNNRDTLAFLLASLLVLGYALTRVPAVEFTSWEFAGLIVLFAFALYGIISEFIQWRVTRKHPGPYVPVETSFQKVLLRWLIRGLLVALLATLIYAAGIVL